MLRLRLFHASDGARIAYREGGTGQPLVLWHSRGLSHREFMPASGELLDRVRLVLPDLPLHGDSEEAPGFPYDIDWTARLLAECTHEVGGARPRVGGSGIGAQLLLRAISRGWLEPSSLILLPGRLHRPARAGASASAARIAASVAAPAGPLIARSVARMAVRPELVSSGASPRVQSLVTGSRTAMLESGERSRAWRRVIAGWDTEEFRELLDHYAKVTCPTLVLWGSDDPLAPLRAAQEAADLIDQALLRTLPATGPLLAYDDPVGMAREIAAFLRDPWAD
ncbi:MAG: alpha/beta hydrolase [Solirubrobacteraceae bacterium]|nr:alpha/beta hydrolase [Solirubrobacteraceae bacterium]